MIEFTTSRSDGELREILALQKENLEANITAGELQKEGFVTVHHDFELLSAMNLPYPHIIAKAEGKVVGYVLVMERSFEKVIPVLVPMCEQINGLVFDGQLLVEAKYFVMGQVCIAKGFRGQGIFAGLYAKMKEEMCGDFDFIITEIAARNQRSIRAHEKVGFVNVLTYVDGDGEDWELVLLDLRE